MAKNIRVAVCGTGHMGEGIIKLLLEKQGIDVVGIHGKRPANQGKDVADVIGLDKKTGIKVETDLSKMLKDAKADIVIQATHSKVKGDNLGAGAYNDMKTILNAGCNLISIAEEAAFPWVGSPVETDDLDKICKEKKLTLLGTGINPGFVLDLLVIALTGVCYRVDSIKATRINDLSPYGYNVMKTQGVNLPEAEFIKGVENGTVEGHFGFKESINMIAKSLNWEIGKIEETKAPIVSKVERDGGEAGKIIPGNTAGCDHRAKAYGKDGKLLIELVHPQQVRPEAEGNGTQDIIEIFGYPDIKISTGPEIPGGKGTIALAVNMIPQVLNNTNFGVVTMADLPVPHCLLGDVRKLIK